jgi:Uma2 family endonuclease
MQRVDANILSRGGLDLPDRRCENAVVAFVCKVPPMATVTHPQTVLPATWSLADLWEQLGRVPLERIRVHPPPGTATLEDAIAVDAREELPCELVDGTLLEKAVGWYESLLAAEIIAELHAFVRKHDFGKVLGEAGTLNILPNMVRIPDVCFIGWGRFPKEGVSREQPIPPVVPDLAVEVLSKSNTAQEMERKLKDYFEAGVSLVWYIDPETRSAAAYTSTSDVTRVDKDGTLDGGTVLPGFKLSLHALFEQADRQRPT